MRSVLKSLSKCWQYGIGRTALASLFAHSVSISVGMCQGYSAILIPQLATSEEFDITSEENSWLASLGAVTTPIGSILAGILGEFLGRKVAIISSSIPFLLGWVCIAWANNIWWLYTGRLLTGFAAGMAIACYTYVAEISPPKHRGVFQALGPISGSFGILLTYSLGWFLRWNLVALISIAFSIFTLVTVLFVPESPAYLLKTDKSKEGFASLMWFRRSNVIAQEEYDKYYLGKEKKENSKSDLKVYLSASTIKPFIVLTILFFLQEMSGIYTILFYAVSFFQDSNLDIDENVSCVIVGVLRMVMSIVAAFLINKHGRKTLCIVSSAGMAVTMLIAGAYFRYYEMYPNENKIFPLLPLICVLFNVVFSMSGMLPVPWILVAEMFPLQVRPIMGGFVICIAQCFIFGSVKIYHDMNSHLNFSGTLLVFAASSVLTLVFCKLILFETKNKTLEEIEEHFQAANAKVPDDVVFPSIRSISSDIEAVKINNKCEVAKTS